MAFTEEFYATLEKILGDLEIRHKVLHCLWLSDEELLTLRRRKILPSACNERRALVDLIGSLREAGASVEARKELHHVSGYESHTRWQRPESWFEQMIGLGAPKFYFEIGRLAREWVRTRERKEEIGDEDRNRG